MEFRETIASQRVVRNAGNSSGHQFSTVPRASLGSESNKGDRRELRKIARQVHQSSADRRSPEEVVVRREAIVEHGRSTLSNERSHITPPRGQGSRAAKDGGRTVGPSRG